MQRTLASSLAALCLSAGLLAPALAQNQPTQPAAQPPAAAAPQADPQQITEDNVIAGTMDIDFGTRTNLDTSGDLKPGSAAVGAKDTYKLTLSVAKTTEFTGTI